MARDYIPAPDADFHIWQNNFVTYVNTHLADRGLVAGDVAPINTAQATCTTDYLAQTAAQTAAQAARQAKDDARAGLEGVIRPLVRQLQASPDVDNAERAAMGITVPDKELSPKGGPPTSGPVIGSTPTVINQVDALTLNAAPLVDYQYAGRVFQARLTTTTTNGTFTYDPGYDSHRRVNSIVNSFTPSGGSPTTIASYTFTRDNNGNPLTQDASGQSPFADDDRTFTVDRLNRLTVTNFLATSETESQTLDRVGNRESHTPRGGSPTAYTLANAANEYATIGGTGVTYDAAGNLTADEPGRQYFYDEQNRLTQIRAPGGVTVLANYAYDALGRRVLFEDPVAGITTRYYYDGPSVIEERDGSDVRVRYHVTGGQFVDEHIVTFDDSSGIFVYYLSNDLYTVAAIGSASGSIIESYNYGAYGLSGPASAPCIRGDMDGDNVVDAADLPQFITVLLEGTTDPHELCAADLNGDFQRDGLDIQPMVTCILGGPCPGASSGSPLRSAFTLHGRPVDVLDNGNLLLQYNRARYYDIRNGRWLQRDPLRYVDGRNLYESFGTNPLRRTDPNGTDDVFDEGNDLVYQTQGFIWTFARGISPSYVLIDHPYWPFAFVMKRADAKELFDTGPFESDFYSPLEIMQKASSLAVDPETPKGAFVAILSKQRHDNYPGGWAIGTALDPEDEIDLRNLASGDIQRRIADAQQTTAVAFTITTGALAAPTGIGGVAVDVVATGADVVSGRTSISGGAVVITAAVAGAFLHLSVADDAIAGAGGLARRGAAEAGVVSDLRFTQTTASRVFSVGGDFRGKSIAEVASLLRTGAMRVEDIPVQYIERGGKRLIFNTRSALALRQAGIDPSKWNLLNKTGDAFVEGEITRRLIKNGLTDEGTPVLRITGAGPGASSLE